MSLSAEAKVRVLVLLYLPLLVFATWYPRHVQAGTVTEATVNGQSIDNHELYAALKLAAGPDVLNKLFEDTVVLQEAARDHLTVADAELQQQMGDKVKDVQNPGMRHILEQEARATLLLKQIALRDISDVDCRHFYDLFKDELTKYDVYDIVADSQTDASTVEEGLKSGQDFGQLAANISRDSRSSQSGGHLGWESRRALRDMFGPEAVELVQSAPVGKASAARPTSYGFLILKVAGVQRTYDELKPDIQTIMANAQRQAIVQKLIDQAQISSPYLVVSPSPSSSPGSGSPNPKNCASPH